MKFTSFTYSMQILYFMVIRSDSVMDWLM